MYESGYEPLYIKELDRVANEAIIKHQRLFQTKVLEMVLGEMIALDGVNETIDRLKWWQEHLEEFRS